MGGVDLVWAPGTASHLDLEWEMPLRALFFEKLGAFCRVIKFDKRGTGLSDRPIRMATLEERADDIRAVIDAEKVERARRPLTPGSVAGVARRTTRRVVRRSTLYVPALPPACVRVNVNGMTLSQCGGVYYQPYGGRYVVVYVD